MQLGTVDSKEESRCAPAYDYYPFAHGAKEYKNRIEISFFAHTNQSRRYE
jgi:hypothetical protein